MLWSVSWTRADTRRCCASIARSSSAMPLGAGNGTATETRMVPWSVSSDARSVQVAARSIRAEPT